MVFLPIRWRETEAQIQGGLVKSLQFQGTKPGMLVHAYYLSARAAEAGGLPLARGQSEIHSEFQTSLKYRTKRLCVKKKSGGEGMKTLADLDWKCSTRVSFSGQPHLCQCTHLPPNSWIHLSFLHSDSHSQTHACV